MLVDEAHNLVARARSMYSAELSRGALRAARAGAPPPLKKALDRVSRNWTELDKGAAAPYQVMPELPDKLLDQPAKRHQRDHRIPGREPGAARSGAAALLFRRACSLRAWPNRSAPIRCSTSRATPAHGSTLCIRNIVPAPFLKARFGAAHSSALFSATLSPWHYYSDALGMPADTALDRRRVAVLAPTSWRCTWSNRISTRFQHRAALGGADRRTDRRASTRDAPGNYLAFFSSFDYLEQVGAGVRRTASGRFPLWRQERRMDEAERAAFLARFAADGCGIGFAVLGGAFGEGIDLPGARLIGAFIATLGLPQMNPVNEQVRQRMEATFGAGYDYTYLYPGMQKVVQAAGRVIRTERRPRRGLPDRRPLRAERGVHALLPRWWG